MKSLLSEAMAFQRVFRFASIPLLAAALAFAGAPQAHTQSLLRDADIEYGLRQVANPVLTAAGLSPARVKILVVNDSSLNAFVVSNDAIFVHYGLINRLDNAAMLQAVIAHEAAHIVNGHLARRMGNLGAARTAASLGFALAVIAAAAGEGKAASGLALGTQYSALGSFFRHTRAEEASADQSGVRYLAHAGIDPAA
ncbi:MAG: M48 family metallopeptidase, partial [Pseudomonadota bacterium]